MSTKFGTITATLLWACLAPGAWADAPEGWLERHPLGEPLDPGRVEWLDPRAHPDLPPLDGGRRYAVIDGVIVELDPDSYELLQLVRRAAGVGLAPGAGAAPAAAAAAPEVPPGHLPPPGSCRVWFPDRPPGHQPPPGPCGADVPPGAVLIQG